MTKIQNFDIENMNDSEVLEAFVFLNLPGLEYKKVNHFSNALGKLIKWYQGVVSYHILIHPYTYRNENSIISPGSEVYEYAEKMDYLINRFYKFKRFLFQIKIAQISLGDYVFNLQHNRTSINIIENNIGIDKLTFQDFGLILSFLPYSISYKFMKLSRNLKKGFIESVNMITFELLKEIYSFKMKSYKKLITKIPIIYECNFFGKYYLMLDSILNSTCDDYGHFFIPFFSCEHLNYIKNIKKESKLIISIAKVFCSICNINPYRFTSAKGEVKISYLDKIKKLIITKKFEKTLRYANKLYMSEEKLKIIKEEIMHYYSIEKLEQIKKINLGLYQLLLWEILVFEYLKAYNPFDFYSNEEIYTTYEQETVEIIKYYIEILNYLKYNLKVKYYFSNKNAPVFDFEGLIENMRNYSKEIDTYNENIFESTNVNYEKIADIYYQKKDIVIFNSMPNLYEKIITEIVAINSNVSYNKIVNNLQMNNIYFKGNSTSKFIIRNSSMGNLNHNINIQLNQLGTIKEEHSLREYKISNINKDGYYNKKITNEYVKLSLFTQIQDDIIIKYMLFYLDINSLLLLTLVNKKANRCLKIHMFIRLHFLGREKKLIEKGNSETIASIEQKRVNFYNEYELNPPELSKAKSLINQITKDDLIKLKFFYKKYNKKYEILIAPFIILLGKKPKSIYSFDGIKNVSFFIPAQKLLNEKETIKKISNFELETIHPSIFALVEQMLNTTEFNEDKVKYYSTPHQHLINWIKGVIVFHRIIRKYSLSTFDYKILDENEIRFCNEMDRIDLLYFKLLRYVAKYCKIYEKKAKQIMNIIKLNNNNED